MKDKNISQWELGQLARLLRGLAYYYIIGHIANNNLFVPTFLVNNNNSISLLDEMVLSLNAVVDPN